MIPKNEREKDLIAWGIKQGSEHANPSAETMRLIKELRDENKEQWSCIKLMKDNNVDMLSKINEMHKVFVGSKFTGKVIIGFFTVASIISAGIFAIISLIRAMIK